MKKLTFILISLILPWVSYAEKIYVVIGYYIKTEGPNTGPTGETTTKIICGIVSENTCYEISLPDRPEPERKYVTTIEDGEIEQGESIVLSISDGTQYSGKFLKYENEPVIGEPFTTRAHVFRYE